MSVSFAQIEIEERILAILSERDILQRDIVGRFPMEYYLEVGAAVRALARRGAITREKVGATYLLRISPSVNMENVTE